MVAATVEYDGEIDTLTADAFRANIARLSELFPEVMETEARATPIRHEMVRQYALERLLMNEVVRRGLSPDSAKIESEMARYRAAFPTEEAFESELEAIHQSEDDLRAQLATTLARDALIESIEDSLPEVTADEIEALQTSLATRLRVQHILIGVPENPGADDLEEARNRAAQLIDSVEAGRPFAMLARRFSDDPGSKISGGELPWFRRGEMVAPFEKAAFELDEGELSEKPVQTPYGYHIIRVLERVEDNAIDADSARALISRRRVREAHENLQRRLVDQATIRTNPAYIPELPSPTPPGG